jgi:hypothetical protein
MEVKEVKLGLEKNLLSVSTMEDMVLEVNFRGEVAVNPKGADPSMRQVIGNRESKLYLLRGQPVKALVHSSDSQSELWYRRMGHLHYRVYHCYERWSLVF